MPGLVKRDWEKDTVYLIQFPRAGSVPSVSPFALKLETWLRMADVKYKNISNEFTRMSSKGQIPFIEYNGREIADSNFVISELSKLLDKQLDSHLSAREKADARAYHALIEDSIRWVMVYERSKNADFFATRAGFDGHLTGVKRFVFKNFLLGRFKKRIQNLAHMQGIGRHSIEEAENIGKEDLAALSEYLGKKKYLTGDKPTKLDATAFGHLSQIYYAPLHTDALKVFMREQTKNLVDYLERIKSTYWPDWDHAIQTLSMTHDWTDAQFKSSKE